MLRIGTLLVLAAQVAHADDLSREDVEKAATALFEQGRQLAEAGQKDAACDKFESSLRLDPQIGTKLNVAACREDKGQLVDAYALFESAALDADRTQKTGRATFARQRMDLLAKKLVRVTLSIAEPDLPGLAITIGGRPVAKSDWSKVHVVQAGRYAIVASAPGKREQRFQHAGAAGTTTAIAVTAFEPDSTTPVTAPRTMPVDESPRASRLPLIIVGAGGLAMVGSVALGLHAKSQHGKAFDRGDAEGVSSAQREADIATGVAVAGAAIITVGVVLYVRERKARDRVSLVPSAAPDAIGLAAVGSF
jgi:hypothetical protein